MYVVNQETPNTNVSATPKNIRKQENIKLPVYAVNPKTPSVVWSQFIQINKPSKNTKKAGAPDKPCGVGRADANPKLLLNDT